MLKGKTLQGAKATFKLRSIIKGWTGYMFPNEATESMAKLRAVECAKCPNAVKGWHDAIIDDEVKSIEGMICHVCTCPLSTKLRSEDEKCPINKW